MAAPGRSAQCHVGQWQRPEPVRVRPQGAVRSADGGRTWEDLVLPEGASLVEADPADPQVLYAGVHQGDTVMVVSGTGTCQAVPTVNDPGAQLARAFGLRRPRDGGAPVGYAVVDRRGQIRYRTLDPAATEELDEVGTVVRAVP